MLRDARELKAEIDAFGPFTSPQKQLFVSNLYGDTIQLLHPSRMSLPDGDTRNSSDVPRDQFVRAKVTLRAENIEEYLREGFEFLPLPADEAREVEERGAAAGAEHVRNAAAFGAAPTGAEVARDAEIRARNAEVVERKERERAEAAGEETFELEDMKVAELKALAAAREVDLGDATRKADIVEKLEAAGVNAPEKVTA